MSKAAALSTLLVVASTLLSPAVAAPVCPDITSKRELNILLPAYIYPSDSAPYATMWAKILADAAIAKKAGFKLVVIVNPSSGVFTTVDPQYTKIIDKLDAAGAMVVGYVYSNWGKRPLGEITTNIAAYRSLYPKVRGIFVDEAQMDTAHYAYYSALRRAAIQKFGSTALVVGNAPGSQLAEARYREAFDVTVAYEDVGGHLAGFVQQPMVQYAAPRDIAYIVNAAGQISATSQLERACAVVKSVRYSVAATRNGGWWFLTTDSGANAYDTLGSEHGAFMQATCWANTLQPCPN